MNTQIVSGQIENAVQYSKQVVFSELLVFLDRLVLVYLKKHYELEDATPDYVYNALNQIIKKIIPIKHATTMSWAKWLLMRNPNILVHL